jgi:hypothetical protein
MAAGPALAMGVQRCGPDSHVRRSVRQCCNLPPFAHCAWLMVLTSASGTDITSCPSGEISIPDGRPISVGSSPSTVSTTLVRFARCSKLRFAALIVGEAAGVPALNRTFVFNCGVRGLASRQGGNVSVRRDPSNRIVRSVGNVSIPRDIHGDSHWTMKRCGASVAIVVTKRSVWQRQELTELRDQKAALEAQIAPLQSTVDELRHLKTGLVHVARLKNGLASTHPIRGPAVVFRCPTSDPHWRADHW